MTSVADKLRDAVKQLDCLLIPPLDELLNARASEIPYNGVFKELKDEPILVLHSSGSTGIPKPVIMTHGSYAVLDNDYNLPKVSGRRNNDLTIWEFEGGGKMYAPFPPFHLAGVYGNIVVPLFTKTIPVFGPPLCLPNGNLAAQILKAQDIRGCFLPPTIASELYSEPNSAELLKRLDVICYAGGPLAESIGNELTKYVTLCQLYGCTEIGPIQQLLPQKEHWQYLEFHPDSKADMQEADDDAYEVVIRADKSPEDSSMFTHNYPGVHEYRTKDLFKPHPAQPGLWRFHGRRDDIIVLSSGGKLNPTQFEASLASLEGFNGALVVGQAQPRVALLVELRPDHRFGPDIIGGLWPAVDRLNSVMPSYGRVAKSMILIADASKPFARAGKGTIIRKLTIAAYQAELQSLFEGLRPIARKKLLKPTAFRHEDITSMLRAVFCEVLGADDIVNDQNLYLRGLDSVKSLEALDEIRANLAAHSEGSLSWLSIRHLYVHPTINDLAQTLLEWLNSGQIPQQTDRIFEMKNTLDLYKKNLPQKTSAPSLSEPREKFNVVIIGSTGYLGQYLLESLCQDPLVDKIFCLNRSESAAKNWSNRAAQKGLSARLNEITFYTVDFKQPRFGLKTEDYSNLIDLSDVIIHSAWQVNFVAPLSSFSDSLNGLTNSITLASNSARRARLLFVSSLAATGVFSKPHTPTQLVPEAVPHDFNAAMQMGYGESKLVAERLVETACTESDVSASVLRIGQIAPSSDLDEAAWPAMDHLRTLLLTAKLMRAVPDDFLHIDWLPVDVVVDAIRDVVRRHCRSTEHSSPGEDLRVYNFVNPTRAPWSVCVSAFREQCGRDVESVPFKEWLDRVRSQSKSHGDCLEEVPAAKLLHFYELVAARGAIHDYEQGNVLQTCERVRASGGIDKGMIRGWLARL